MRTYLYLVAGIIGLMAPGPVAAKDAPNYMGAHIDAVEQFAALARDNITRAIGADGQHMPAETPEERAVPLVPDSENLRIVNRGILTGMADYCGFDWREESFRPFMAAERARQIWTDKQLAYIGLLHGIAQGYSSSGLEKSGPCDAARRAETQDALNQSRP